MLIGGFQKFTLSDFPGRSAAIVFTRGCNFRCPWCHNHELIDPFIRNLPGESSPPDALSIIRFLEKRVDLLDGVVITGGEPTIQEGLQAFLRTVKALGYMVKLDTNGSRPEVLVDIIDEGLVDYFAMDIKAPFEKYDILAGKRVDLDSIRRSIELLAGSGIQHEFRTTHVPDLLSESDILDLSSLVPPGSKWKVQKYRDHQKKTGEPHIAPTPEPENPELFLHF
ncbi:MAG: anaerobic ribonucleoside-triphosphate reductase activating protein [Candidatus Krumholzibacteria bacterium]|nr:anaerobic ribonucleoside-triphosphate reductase activating protein [Candidatus Krumholzibacteria bacterium]